MKLAIQPIQIQDLIHTVRGEKVILDSDLARIYGVATFRFNEAVKRNQARFPADFRFQLTRDEVNSLTSQIAISKPSRGGGAASLTHSQSMVQLSSMPPD